MGQEIKIKVTKYQKAADILALVLVAGTFLFLILSWSHIPDRIPAHYGASGVVDRWGGKGELLFCPIVSACLYALITLCERHPSIWNTGVTVTDKNRQEVYHILKNLVVTAKLVAVLIFTFLTVNSAMAKSLPGWFLPVGMVLMFGPIVYFINRLFKKCKE